MIAFQASQGQITVHELFTKVNGGNQIHLYNYSNFQGNEITCSDVTQQGAKQAH